MGKRVTRKDITAELMGDDIIGVFLSEEPLRELNQTTDDSKLQRFIYDGENIEILRLLGSGEHGVVLLADIKGIQYALKVFKNWKQPGPVYYSYNEAICTSPLASESRAFARLHSRNENGTWAAKCYGWTNLSEIQSKMIGESTGCDLSRWVIVKEYLPTLTNPSHIQQIFSNFRIPKEARIIPQDVWPQNYREAKIVDLSNSLTEPCPEWSEYLFGWFYGTTVYGVNNWFQGEPKEDVSSVTVPSS